MTELLYLEDSYQAEFTAKVIEVAVEENAVVLDRTAFYPTGGGQPCDFGEIKFAGKTTNVIKPSGTYPYAELFKSMSGEDFSLRYMKV